MTKLLDVTLVGQQPYLISSNYGDSVLSTWNEESQTFTMHESNSEVTIENIKEHATFIYDFKGAFKSVRADTDTVLTVEITDGQDYHTVQRVTCHKDSGAPKEPEKHITSAKEILNAAVDTLVDRAKERDQDEERSMSATVNAFNAMYNLNLTEEQGWMFMVFLKASRSKYGIVKLDDYVDGSGYFSLAGEAAVRDRA